MPSSETNLEVARSFFELQNGGSVVGMQRAILATTAPDVVLHVPKSAPLGGTIKGQAAVLKHLTGPHGVSIYQPGTMQVVFGRPVTQDEFVVIPYHFTAITAGGKGYENDFIFIFRFRDHRIVEMWETFDTLEMYRVYFDLEYDTPSISDRGEP